jgi:hypothetical protein
MPRARLPECLFLTEGEIALRLGLSAIKWQSIASALEKSGLPKADPLFGNRRYFPAVIAFLDRRAGLSHDASSLVLDGEENWNGNHGRSRAGS